MIGKIGRVGWVRGSAHLQDEVAGDREVVGLHSVVQGRTARVRVLSEEHKARTQITAVTLHCRQCHQLNKQLIFNPGADRGEEGNLGRPFLPASSPSADVSPLAPVFPPALRSAPGSPRIQNPEISWSKSSDLI